MEGTVMPEPVWMDLQPGQSGDETPEGTQQNTFPFQFSQWATEAKKRMNLSVSVCNNCKDIFPDSHL